MGIQVCLCVGEQLGGGTPAFHTLAEDMPLNRDTAHFTLRLRPCILILHIINIPAPPSQSYQVAPLRVCVFVCGYGFRVGENHGEELGEDE